MQPYLHVAIVLTVLGAAYAASAYRVRQSAVSDPASLLGSAARALGLLVVRGNPDQPVWGLDRPQPLLQLLGVTCSGADQLLEGSAGARPLSLSVRSREFRIRLRHFLRFELSSWFDARLTLGGVRSPLTLEAWVERDGLHGHACVDEPVERILSLPERARESMGRGSLVVTASAADVMHLLPALRSLSAAGYEHVVVSGTEVRYLMTRAGLVAATPHLAELRAGLVALADAVESRA